MHKIVEQGYVKENALVQYIIDDVQDDDCNKAVLYNATTIYELKKCFEVYKGKKLLKKTTKNGSKDTKKVKVRSKSGIKPQTPL